MKPEFLDIARSLETYSSIFGVFVRSSEISYSDKLPTAAVDFSKDSDEFQILINKDWFSKLTQVEQQFVFAHEAMHVVFEHPTRIKNGYDPKIANIAMDICINETLLQSYGFNKADISIYKTLCFIDTVFKKEEIPNIKTGQSFEYYYNLLIKNQQGAPNKEELDDHSSFWDMLNEGHKEEVTKAFFEKLVKSLPKEELEKLEGILDKQNEECENTKAGTSALGALISVSLDKVKKKRKWESVIKKWTNSKIRHEDKSVYQWAMTNRRFATIGSDLILPTEYEIEDRELEKKKITIVFFQDTSGSCYHLAQRFFNAARSIPEDLFNVEAYCFDTRVYRVDLKKPQVYGGGGTAFSILEDKVASMPKYPDAIFVITDGRGDEINPKHPNRWHWFLTYDYRYCIPSTCNFYDLKNFE